MKKGQKEEKLKLIIKVSLIHANRDASRNTAVVFGNFLDLF